MNKFHIIAIYGFTLCFSPGAMAEPTSRDSVAPPQETRIEADNDTGTIDFYVKGQLAAVLDESGLHVRNDIIYGGMVIDSPSVFSGPDTETGDRVEGQ